MSEQKDLLEDSISVLRSIRVELHGKVENGVILLLDQVIEDLEEKQKTPMSTYSPVDLLFLLGSILEKLPAIVAAIELLRNIGR